MLASPGTLFAVLRTIGAIWQQDAVEQNARELLALGQDLYVRLGTLGAHVTGMGQSLARSVEHYNRFVGTLESRVLVTARRMHELDLVTQPPAAVEPLEASPRSLSAAELIDAEDEARPGGAGRALPRRGGRPLGHRPHPTRPVEPARPAALPPADGRRPMPACGRGR